MAAQGRKNVHGKAGVRFKAGYTASKNKSMLRNVVSSLIINGEVKVTSGVVKELKTLADHMFARDSLTKMGRKPSPSFSMRLARNSQIATAVTPAL